MDINFRMVTAFQQLDVQGILREYYFESMKQTLALIVLTSLIIKT